MRHAFVLVLGSAFALHSHSLAFGLGAVFSRPTQAVQDGNEKLLAPLRSDIGREHADRRIPLLSQLELAKESRTAASIDHDGLPQNGEEAAGIPVQRRSLRRAMAWVKQIEYSGKTFFDGWDFFTAPGESLLGRIRYEAQLTIRPHERQYVDRDTAFAEGLAFWTQDGAPGIQVEHWAKTAPGTPRNSVRIHTKALFSGGLYLIDMKLMPWGCGVWPAFWTLGYYDTWPHHGEIDIVEGIQSPTNNQMTLHSMPGCTTNQQPGLFSGTVASPNCDSSTGGSGCSTISNSNTSYGLPFNKAGGGVFAMLWDASGVRIWNWNRAGIPAEGVGQTGILASTPQPLGWGLPAGAWDAATCDPAEFFQAQQLILNINLCGEWAGDNYAMYPYCPGTCAEHVADPNNLNNTVMLVNYIKVFQQADLEAVVAQAGRSNNVTGAGGAVPGDSSRSTSYAVRRSRGWYSLWGSLGFVGWGVRGLWGAVLPGTVAIF